MKRPGRHETRGSLDLLEEAVHLLRTAPAGALACYAIGAVPFVLGFLYFWADMSRSPFASRHLADYTLAMALLFLWMKFWQALFTRALLRHLTGAAAPLNWRAAGRIFLTQAALQPTGLFLVALATIPVLPLPWVFGFYQNLTVQADGTSADLGPLLKRALRQAGLWPKQNHVLVLCLSAFGLFVFINWVMMCFLVPQLLKMLLGIESTFTRSELSLFNSTFFVAMFGLTYLSVDPLVKAVYTLRCFYGSSLESGEDLKSELHQLAVGATRAAAVLVLILGLGQSCLAKNSNQQPPLSNTPLRVALAATGQATEADNPNVTAEQPAPSGPRAAQFSTEELDKTIREVAQHRKYVWRMPKEQAPEPEETQRGVIGRFLERVAELAASWLKAVGKAIARCAEAVAKAIGWVLRKLFGGRALRPGGAGGYGWMVLLQLLLYALALAVVVGLALLLYRVWRRRQNAAAAVPSQPLEPAPDLADENVGAEQLPEDGWSKLGRELLAKGELRLALRAFYLASLAHLAARNLVQLAKFKSNREYERELRRRGHAFPELLALFGRNVAAFEPVWYGRHQVQPELVEQFAANLDRIRQAGVSP